MYNASGHGAWEASLTNLLSPGDTILVLESGYFSEEWANMARGHGLDVRLVEADWRRGVDIAELSTRSYAAAHTGAPMFSVQLIVNVPSRLHIGVLREEFMDFCDHLNLDAIFEPVKS